MVQRGLALMAGDDSFARGAARRARARVGNDPTTPRLRQSAICIGRRASESEIASLTLTPNQRFPPALSRLNKRGVSRSSRTLRRDAVDAAATQDERR